MQSRRRSVSHERDARHEREHGSRRGDELDPREAARLLDQTRREARRQFDLRPPLLSAVTVVVVIAATARRGCRCADSIPTGSERRGARRPSTRRWPSGVATSAMVFRRATAGVERTLVAAAEARGGRRPGRVSRHRDVFQGALHHDGASHAIVYGVMPAAAPLIIVGATARASRPAGRTGCMFGTATRRRRDRRRSPRSRARSRAGRSPASACPFCIVIRAGVLSAGIARVPGAGIEWHDTLDPVIHAPARLRIVATLAALADGDTLSFTRLQDMLDLTPGQPDHPPAQARGRRLRHQREDRQRRASRTVGRTHRPGPRCARHLHQRAARPARRAVDP